MRAIARITAGILGWIVALMLVIGPALYLGRDDLPGRLTGIALGHGLGLRDVPRIEFRITGLGRDHLTLAGITVGDAATLRAERVRVGFTLDQLLAGQVAGVEVTGLQLAGSTGPSGISLGTLDPLLQAAGLDLSTMLGSTGKFAIESDRTDLLFDDAPGQAWPALVDARVESIVSLVQVESQARISTRLIGHWDGTGRGIANLTIFEAVASSGPVTVGGAIGRIALETKDWIPSTVDGSIETTAFHLSDGTARPARLAVGWEGDSLSLDAGIGASGTESSVKIKVDGAGKEIAVAKFDADTDLSLVSDIATALGLANPPPGSGGRLRIDGRGAVALPFNRNTLAGTLEASGGIEIDARLPIPVLSAAPTGLTARLAVTVSDGIATVQPIGQPRVSIGRPAPELLAALPELLLPGLARGGEFTIAGTDDTATVIYPLERARGPIRVQLPYRLTTRDGPRLDGKIDMIAEAGNEAAAWQITLRDLSAATTEAVFGPAHVQTANARLSGTVGPDQASIAFQFDGAGGYAAPTEFEAKGGIRLSGDLRRDGKRTTINISKARVEIAEMRDADGRPLLAKATRLNLMPNPAPEVTIAGTRAEFALALEAFRTGVEIADETLAISIGPLSVSGQHDFDTAAGASGLKLGSSSVEIPARELAVRGITAQATLQAGNLTPAGSLSAVIVDMAPDTRFAPLTMTAQADIGSPVAKLEVKGAGGVVLAKGEIGLDRSASRLRLGPIAFAADALQPEHLVPSIKGLASEVTGAVSADLTVAWTPDGNPEAGLKLAVEDLSLNTEFLTLKRAHADLEIESFFPLRAPATQTLVAAGLGVGLPIEEPILRLRLLSTTQMRVQGFDGRFAGGSLSADPFTLELGKPFQTMLRLKNVDASQIADMAELEGLSVEGKLAGTIPVSWDPLTGLAIRDGTLAASGPGVVRYGSDQTPAPLRESGEQVSLMLQALRNFHYRSLRLGLNGRQGADHAVTIALEGANPELYDGYPFKFNVALSGPLDKIVQSGMQSFTLSDRVRDLVRERAERGVSR
ncbi:MAG: hypothetical protein HOH65_03155 [Rhodospirillaceae bacterium]|nr:hypothetical protein [Rhodospirillaceae bacterium]